MIKKALEKGIEVVAAAGNTTGSVSDNFPANVEGVISVSGVGPNHDNGSYALLAGFTSGGIYAAPATDIAAHRPGGTTRKVESTSFAAPQISAALALLKVDSEYGKADMDKYCQKVTGTVKGMPDLKMLASKFVEDIRVSIPQKLRYRESEEAYGPFAISYLPEDASDPRFEVESKNEDVVTAYIEDGYLYITCKQSGEGKIVIRSLDEKKFEKQFTVNIYTPVKSIELSGYEKTDLYVGDVVQLNAVVSPENADLKTVRWYTSDREGKIATVDETGKVTAVGEGIVTVTAEAKDGYQAKKSVQFTITKIPDPISVSIDNAPATLEVGQRIQLTATVLPEDAPQDVVWSCRADESVATIDPETGLFEAKGGAGQPVIVSVETKTGGKWDVATITIVQKVIDIVITGPSHTMKQGGAMQLTATVTPSDASNKEVFWKSGNSSIATVSSNGLVTAINTGATEDKKVTIYAESTDGTGIRKAYSITVQPNVSVITFDANGGSCTETTRTVVNNTPIGELPVPTRQNYTFDYWYYGSDTKVTASTVFTSDTTLKAHWTRNTITITFDANGGSCSESERTMNQGDEIGSLPTPTRDYYTFDYWYYGSDTKVTASTVFTSGTTLKAHWAPKPYQLFFNWEGIPAKECLVGIAIGELPTPTRTYYDFEGWFTAANGEGAQITESYVQDTDEAITVYPYWHAKKYTVTFNANGGSCSEQSRQVAVDTPIGALPTPTRSYYSFQGWYTAASGGNQVTATYQQSTIQDITLYAHWNPMPYTIKYYASLDGAVLSGSSTGTGYVDTSIGTMPTASKTYWTFNGWYTAASGGKEVTSTYKQSNTNTLNLYGHWTHDTCVTTFNANGGSCSTSSKTTYKGEAIGSLPTATRDYYTFDGWYTSGGSRIYTSTLFYSNSTVYAHWTKNNYTYNIRYQSSNGTLLGTATATNPYGSSVTLSAPAYSGYITPGKQTVSWDSAQKTVTFVYKSDPVAYSRFEGYRSESSPKEGYVAVVQYQNRTANSVQVR